jgi:acyl-CoA dehydrogenase
MTNEVRAVLDDLFATMPAYQLDGSWSQAEARRVFERLTADGWTRVGLPEALGGSGGEIADAAALVAAAAGAEQLLPLTEIVLVSCRLLQLARLQLPADVACAIPVPAEGSIDRGGCVQVRAHRVPWASWASHYLLTTATVGGVQVHLVDASAAQISGGHNLAGEPRDDVIIAATPPIASASVAVSLTDVLTQQRLAGALGRSVQMSALIEHALEMTARYCDERHQFGRPIGAFQAVQQELAALAGESAAASAAVAQALDRVACGDEFPVAPIAIAKARTGIAAGAAARLSHQLHGAIGTTLEYPLSRCTTPMWSWRDDFGNEHEWARLLAQTLMSDGSARVWQRLVAL